MVRYVLEQDLVFWLVRIAVVFIIEEDTVRGPIQIVELPGPERPEKRRDAEQAQEKGGGYQVAQRRHETALGSSFTPAETESRSAVCWAGRRFIA